MHQALAKTEVWLEKGLTEHIVDRSLLAEASQLVQDILPPLFQRTGVNKGSVMKGKPTGVRLATVDFRNNLPNVDNLA